MNKSILLIGEGDFSFAASLSCDVHSKINIVATCYKSNELKFTAAQQKNINFITSQGGIILTDVDATKLYEHHRVKELTLSQIRFNFPHVDKKMNIKLNRNLLAAFFQSCYKLLIATKQEEVDIVVTLCAGQGGTPADEPFRRRWDDSWKIVQFAAEYGFLLRDVSPFFPEAYIKYTSTGYRYSLYRLMLNQFWTLSEYKSLKNYNHFSNALLGENTFWGTPIEMWKQEKSFRLDGALVHTFTLGRVIDLDHFHPDVPVLSSVPFSESSSFLIPKFYGQRITRYRSHMQKIFSMVIVNMLTSLDDSHFIIYQDVNDSLYVESKVDLRNELYIQIYPERSERPAAEDGSCENSSYYYLRQTLIDNYSFDDLELDHCRITTGMIFQARPIQEQFDAVQEHMVFHYKLSNTVISDCYMEAVTEMTRRALSVDIEFGSEIADDHKMEYTWLRYFKKLSSQFTTVQRVPITTNSDTIGLYFKCNKTSTVNSHVFLCFDLSALLRTKLAIRDTCLLWSPVINLADYVDVNSEEVYKPPVLYPLQTDHDISFWCCSGVKPFDEIDFGLFLKNYLGDYLKEVRLLEEYREGSSPSAERVSRCYRLTYRSCDSVLSKSMTNDIQTNLRIFLNKYPSIILR